MAMGMAGPDMAWRRRVALKRIGGDVHEPRTRVPVGSVDQVTAFDSPTRNAQIAATRTGRSGSGALVVPRSALRRIGPGSAAPGPRWASTDSALAYAFEIELDTCWKCLAMPSNHKIRFVMRRKPRRSAEALLRARGRRACRAPRPSAGTRVGQGAATGAAECIGASARRSDGLA